MSVQIYAVGRPEVAPLAMSDRFRHEVTYFMSLPGEPGVPAPVPNLYWIGVEKVRHWLDEGVFHLVSPLDGEKQTEVELSEEHETWLEWLVEHEIDYIELRERAGSGEIPCPRMGTILLI